MIDKVELVLKYESEVPRSVALHISIALEAQAAAVKRCASDLTGVVEGISGGEDVIKGTLALAGVLHDLAAQVRKFHLGLQHDHT